MEIFLVCYIKVVLSREYCYGILDVELVDSWENDVVVVREKLDGWEFYKIFVSFLKRCKVLVSYFLNDVIEDKELLEMSLGDWEFQKWVDFDQDELEKWMNDFVNFVLFGSESFFDYFLKFVFFYD